MTQAKRGRPRKVVTEAPEIVAPVIKPKGSMKCKVPNALSDGEGGFIAVGEMFEPADDAARASLIAKGLAE